MKVAVIGGGAAGFYTAIMIAEHYPKSDIVIFEKTNQFLAKVKVSGGGRCNVTNQETAPHLLAKNYPRGEKVLKNVFKTYGSAQVKQWFESNGVALKTEPDGRVFPITDKSQTIIDLFYDKAEKYKINLQRNAALESILLENNQFRLKFKNENTYLCDKVVIAIGGHQHIEAYQFLQNLGHSVNKPIPSLFTFNAKFKIFAALAGISVPNAIVKIETTKFNSSGALLITHVGLSGPVIIKLSAWAAQYLYSQQYKFNVLINWLGIENEVDVMTLIENIKNSNPAKKIVNAHPDAIPKRLWEKLVELSSIPQDLIWRDISNKLRNKLLENLYRCKVEISSKTTFKEEFVTCGGIPLAEIKIETMESKIVPNLYFAGEVIDIDGLTGGYNFQSAWSTTYLVGKSIFLNK
jgi:predicted Rossmann fold flavoprotein